MNSLITLVLVMILCVAAFLLGKARGYAIIIEDTNDYIEALKDSEYDLSSEYYEGYIDACNQIISDMNHEFSQFGL